MTKLSSDAIDKIMSNGNMNTSDTEITLNEINDFGNRDSVKGLMTGMASYNKNLKQKITFINDDVSAVIPFTKENMYLICAYTGSGKSTMAANISYPLWRQKKKILIISNEEEDKDVILRIACLHLGYNFNDYKKGTMPLTLQKQLVVLFPDITQYVKVVDVKYKDGLTTRKEGVINILEQVKSSDFSAVLIDYYQLIRYSVDKSEKTYKVLDDLRIYFGRYIKESTVPLVVFAQLHSLGKRNNTDLDSRIKECPSIMEPATVILEMVPNFELQCTDINIKKDRFGMQGKVFRLGYDKGKFVTYDQEFESKMSSIRQAQQTEDIAGKLAALQDDLKGTGVQVKAIEEKVQPDDVSKDTTTEGKEDTTTQQ